MELILTIVSIAVTSMDPTMWVGPIVGAFVSRRWWVAPALGVLNAIAVIALVFSLPNVTLAHSTADFVFLKLAAGILLGFVAFGIGTLIRRGKKAPTQPTSS